MLTQSPTGLMVNLLSQPGRALITRCPLRFSWIVPVSMPDDTQSAYRILVASAADQLIEGKADLWDSGQIPNRQSLHVAYGGKPLGAGQTLWWTVRTWNRAENPSAWAVPQLVRLGRMDRSDDLWPGESRWVQIANETDSTFWGFEDRPPVDYHPRPRERRVARSDGVTFLDFGRAAFSALRLTLAWDPPPGAPREARIEIAVGEKAVPDETAIDTQPGGGVIFRRYPLDLRAGTHTYDLEFPRFAPKYPHSQVMPAHMPEVVPFRYAEVRPGGLTVDVAGADQLALWSQFEDAASDFHSSSPELDAIYELCKYSLKVNTFNGDYASSERERMMYEADTCIQQMGHYAVDREFAIARYSVANMLHHGSWPTEWISHCLLMAWADYLHTGDASFLEEHYETLKPKTLTALAREDGLISTRTGLQTPEFLAAIHAPGLRDIVDWPTHMADGFDFRDFNCVVNAFYFRSLVLMAGIAAVVGHEGERLFFIARAEKVRAAFGTAFFDQAAGLYRDGIGSNHHSFHANLFALAFGLVEEPQRPALIAWLKSRGMACGVYPAHYVLETFFDHGEAGHALALMLSHGDRGWLNMLRMGSTVTTEAWDMKYKENISWTHAWSASPAHIIPRKLMGIEPVEPGFGRVKIRPQLASLEHASVRLPTIRGEIQLSAANRAPEPYSLDLTLPGNVSASVAVPAFDRADDLVEIDGEPVRARREGVWLTISPIGAGHHRITRRRN